MKSILVILFALLNFGVFAQDGIDFFAGSWEEALAEAKAQDKIIFMDAYAVWCGPCKRMAATVFTDKRVGSFYNDKFINLKVDMEKGEGKKLQQKYRVSAYPTLLYIDYTGKVVQRVKGARDAEAFIALGKTALTKVDRSEEYAIEYEKGNRDPDLVYKYIKALNNAAKPSAKIANDYLNKQKDPTTEDNLKIILEATVNADSRIFKYLIQYRKQIAALTSPELVNEKIQQACNNTVLRAIEYEDEGLLEEAKDKMKAHFPEQAKSFALQKDMEFCLGMHDKEAYLNACNQYVKKGIKDKPEELNELALSIRRNFTEDPKAMQQAEEISAKAAKSNTDFKYYLTYARILDENGKKSEAMKAMENCLRLTEKEKDKEMVRKIMERMKSS